MTRAYTHCTIQQVYDGLLQVADSLERLILVHEHGTKELEEEGMFGSLVSFRRLKTLAIDVPVLIGLFLCPKVHPVPMFHLLPRTSLAALLPESLEKLPLTGRLSTNSQSSELLE